MIPILFPASATTFNTNGLGRLADCLTCVVSEERNGPYECEITYPVTGVHFNDIKLSSIVVVKPSPTQSLQAFRVYRMSRPMKGVVTIYLRHISYQLSFIPFKAFSAQSLAGALAGFKTNALEPCPFTMTADFTSTSSFAVPLPASIRSYLGGREGSIIDVYGNGAEWEWDNYNCKLHAHRGADRGVVLRYGKNIIDLKQEQNIENTITGVLSYWTSDQVNVVLSTPVESPTAQNFPFPRTVVVDMTDKWENAPTQAELRQATQRFVQQTGVGIPKVSIELSFLNLADTLEYKDNAPAEQISLCDTITVDFVSLGVQTKAKIVKVEYDVLLERYNKLNIGDSRSSLADTIEDQLQALTLRPTLDQTRTSIDRATGVLNSGLRGHVIINRNQEGWANEILFLDNENMAAARNVLRINNAGIGFSSTGYQGPYYQSWTIDGHFALGGVNNAYGDFEILDSSGKPLGEWNKDGLRFFDDSGQRVLLSVNHGGMFLYNAAGNKLAQLTPDGLNVYEGSIEGGTIKIGNNFNVDRNGNLTANNAKFNGGTIQIGNKFQVKADGTMTATGATFSGKINAGTIDIGKNFHVDKDGNLKASAAEITGEVKGSKITGSTISGSSIQSVTKDKEGKPMFEITKDYFKLLDYYAVNTGSGEEGTYLEKRPGNVRIFTSGFGDNDGWLLWYGWLDPDSYPDASEADQVFAHLKFGIHNDDVFAYDVYLSGCSYHGIDFPSVGAVIESLDMRVSTLEARVNGGGA